MQTFNLPYLVKTSKFKVAYNNGFDKDLLNFCLEALVDGFKWNIKVATVMTNIVALLCKREKGLWHCSFRPKDIEGAVAFYSLRNVLLTFKRNKVSYVVSIAQIH